MSKSSYSSKRIIIAGAGLMGREFVRLMAHSWEIIVLDPSADALASLRAGLPADRQLRTLALDATSLINLREAGADGAAWVVALTGRDAVNIEVCRLALSLDQPPAALGVVAEIAAQESLKRLGADAFVRPAAMASLLANQIDRGMRVAVSVGLGRGEVVEIPVLPSSPAAGVQVAELGARRWLVAAIYRGEEIIIPHGHARINVGDRLLLSGEPDMLPRIADYLRAGVPRFPIQFGARLLIVGDGPAAFWNEVGHMARNTRVAGLCSLIAEGGARSPGGASLTDLPHTVVTIPDREPLAMFLQRNWRELDGGCVVLPKPSTTWARRIGLTRPPYAAFTEHLQCPTLLVSGGLTYKRLILPVTDSAGTALGTDLAIDLARQLGLPLSAVTVNAPAFVAGQGAEEAQQRALQSTAEAAALYRIQIEQIRLEGNPVRELARYAQPGDLLVVANRAGRRASLFRPDTSQLIIEHVACSVLYLPHRERTPSP